MFYRLFICFLLMPIVSNAGPFDGYKITPKSLKSFYRAFHTMHPRGHIQKAEPLGGESIDKVFKISVLEDDKYTYFVRFLKRKGTSLNHEKIKITRAMADIWQGPAVLVQADDHKSFITEFIQGRHLTLVDLKDPVLFKDFVNKLKESHSYLKPVGNDTFPDYCMAKRTGRRLKEIKDRSIDLPNADRVNDILKSMECHQADGAQVIHNDIRPENIMVGVQGSPHLIDWAEVTYGNIYNDLGAFAEFFDLPPLMERALIKQYFNKGASSDSLARLKVHRWISGLHRAAFKFRKALDAMGQSKPTTWQAVLHTDNHDLKMAADKLEVYMKKVDDLEFRKSLEKSGVVTHISIIERVLLWLKTLVKGA